MMKLKREIGLLLEVTTRLERHAICALGDPPARRIQCLIRHFRHGIERRIDEYDARPAAEPALAAE